MLLYYTLQFSLRIFLFHFASLAGMESAPRKLAILFADIAGSTKLYETLGDAEALATIGRCLEIMKSVCEEHGGRVVKTIGDETMAGLPAARQRRLCRHRDAGADLRNARARECR